MNKKIVSIVFISCVLIFYNIICLSQDKEGWNRWLWQQANKVMDIIGVKPGMVIADIGAGSGYFTLKMAKRVGDSGLIYANDIDEKSLKILDEDCKKRGINNVNIIKGEQNDPLLPKNKMDLVLMVHVMNYLKNPVLFLKNIKPCMKPEAALVIIDWDDEKNSYERDFGRSGVFADYLKYIHSAGYEVIKVETFLSMQCFYICKPKK